MRKRGAEYSIALALDILKVVLEMGRPSTQDVARALSRDYSVILRYRDALEKLGLVRVVPEENRNVIELTPYGECIARCARAHSARE